jgi:hypothetical protein
MTKSAGEAISVTNAQALKCASGKCDQPVLTNATHRIKAGSCRSKQSAGAECELECAVGHITASSTKGICKLDSSSGKLVYSGQSLVCRAATCATVAQPSGGTVIKTGTCLAHGAQNSQRHVCIFECAPGYFRKLQAQESSNEQVGLCKPIAKGARYIGQKATCDPCPAGSFRALSGQYTMCEQCAAGQYQNVTQQTRCHVCSPGSFQDRTGQINCKSCPPGQSQSRAGSIKCYLCPPGKYQSAVGQQACLSCTPGSTTDTVANPGATQCSTCATGKFSASAQTKCVQCARGKISGSPGMTECKRCPDGHSSNQQATSCAKTKCVALSTKLLHSIDVHAVIRAGSCVASAHGSTCHLTCVDGYTVRNAVSGVCSADMGSSSSSYKKQSVKCVPSQCAAVPVLAPRKVLYGCGNGTMLNDIKSTCLLGCMDGYRAADGSIAPGQCLPNSGLPTASVQGHSISCIPQPCDAPTLRVGQTIINGCAGTPGLHNDNAMGKTCLLGCGSGYRNRTHYELGVCRPVLGRPTAAYQWTHQPVECEPVNVCNDDGFAINSFKDFCHVNSSCVTSGLPGSARCICNPGSTGRVMEINVTFRVATRTNIIAQVTSSVLPKAHCSLIPCPAYSSGWGGGSQCVCTGNYSGSIKWSKQRNMYLGSCSRCDPEQGSVPDPSGTMCWCMKGWTWTGTRCRRCEIGSFKDEVSNAACNLCKHTASGPGSTTRTEGSTSKRDCVCNEGHFNVSRGRIKCEHELASGIDDGDTKSVSAQFECQRCPACAICLIDDEFYPAVNYWTFDPKQVDRTSDETKGDMFTTGRLIFACNNGRGCVCSASNGSALAVDEIGCTGTNVNDCAVGYHGVACGECDRAGNFGRYGQQCVECASWVFTLLMIVMAVLLVCLVLFFRMKAASGTRVGVRKSRMIPIFMAYLQVTWCVGAFKLQWPTLASRFFTSAGVATGSSLSFIDCYIPTTFYDQFLLMCSIPLAAVLVPLARHCTSKEIDARQRLLCRSSAAFAADAKGNPPKSMLFFLIIIVIMHPGITKNALEMFNCRSFEHEYRLELDTSIDCLLTVHKFYEVGALLVLILFTFGVPLSLFGYIYSRRTELQQDLKQKEDNGKSKVSTRRIPIRAFGFLVGGYKFDTWFWEDIIILRKVAIVSIVVFLRFNVFDQTFAALFVIYMSLMLQYKYNPFVSRLHNFAEYLSLITTTVTLNIGVASYGGALSANPDQREAMGFCLLFLNSITTMVLFGIIVYEQFAKAKQKFEHHQEKRRAKLRSELKIKMAKKLYTHKASVSAGKGSLNKFKNAAAALAFTQARIFEVEGDSATRNNEPANDFCREYGVDLPDKVAELAEALMSECEKEPHLFEVLATLFGHAHEVFGRELTAEDLRDANVVEAFVMVDSITTQHEAAKVCKDSGLLPARVDKQATLGQLKAALVDHYCMDVLDSISHKQALEACEEASIKAHPGMGVNELRRLLREHLEAQRSTTAATHEREDHRTINPVAASPPPVPARPPSASSSGGRVGSSPGRAPAAARPPAAAAVANSHSEPSAGGSVVVRKPSGWPSFGIQLSRCPMDSQSQLPQLLRCIRDSCQAPDAILARPLPSAYFTAAPDNDAAAILQRRLNDGADFSVSKDLHACFYVLRQWMLQLPAPGLFEDVPSTETEVGQCSSVAQAQQVLERRAVSALELRVLRCVLGLLTPHINPQGTGDDGTCMRPKDMACVVGPLLGLQRCSAPSANLFALLLLAGAPQSNDPSPRPTDNNARRIAELFRIIDMDSSGEISFWES